MLEGNNRFFIDMCTVYSTYIKQIYKVITKKILDFE
jgi:hypothetical protein